MAQLSITPNDLVPFEIVRENRDYIVVYKPSGVATQPGIKHMKDTL